MGAALLEQCVEARQRVAGAGQLQRLHGPCPVLGGAVVGPLGRRHLGGADRPPVGVLGRTGGGTGQRVVGELRDVAVEVAGPQLGDRGCGGRVHPGAPDGVQLRRQGLGDQCVRELEPGGQVGLDEDAGEQRRLESVEDVRRGGAGDLTEHVDVEGAPHDGRGREQRLGVARQSADAAPDHVLHGRGRGAGAHRVGIVEPPLGVVEVDDLAHEEGVPTRAVVNQLGDIPAVRSGGAHREPLLDVVGSQAGEVDPHCARRARQLAHAVDESRGRIGPGRSNRGEEQDAGALELGGHVLDQTQAGRIGPLEVVDHRHHQTIGGGQHVAHAGVQAQPVGVGHLGELGGRGGRQQAGDQVARQGPRPLELAPDLHTGPVGGAGGRLGTAAPGHHRLREPEDELLDQPGLADAGLAGEDHRAASTGGGLGGGAEQRVELALAPDEGPIVGTWRDDVDRGRHSDGGSRPWRRRSRGIEVGRLGEDVGLQATEVRAGLHAHLLDERRSRRREGGERLPLPPGAVERQRLLGAQPLSEGVRGDGALQPREERHVLAERQPGVEACLEGLLPQSLQPGGVIVDPGLAGQVGEQRPVPQGEGVVERLDRRAGVAACQRRDPHRHEILELGGIDVASVGQQGIARRLGDEQAGRFAGLAVRLEGAPQVGDVGLQRGLGVRRRVLAPDEVLEPRR